MAVTKCSIVNMVHSLCDLYCTVSVYLVTGNGFVGAHVCGCICMDVISLHTIPSSVTFRT